MSGRDITARLRWLLDEFESHSETAEFERSTCAKDHSDFALDRAAARRVVDDAIELLKRAGLAGTVVERAAEPEA